MIKINKSPEPPQILVENHTNWTNELLEALENHNSFSELPTRFSNRYKHPQIKEKLLECSYNKCAYCESFTLLTSPMHVEHYKPKSLYPNLAYDWNNLLPSCPLCNNGKGDLDTGIYPIINPCEDDPEDFFEYWYLRIKPKERLSQEDKLIAIRTLDVCDLNRAFLYSLRADLIKAMHIYEDDLKIHLNDINICNSDRRKYNLINKLRRSIIDIENLSEDNKKYAGFIRDYITKSEIIQSALILIRGVDSAT